MAELVWGESGSKFYETGVDKGVLYLNDGSGVPWNGLLSVDKKTDTKTESYYFDGQKFIDFSRIEDFEGSIKAYTYPDEFSEYEGWVSSDYFPGVFFFGQTKKTFGLSYRTLIGNDIDDLEHGYKIHILYNLTTIPDDISHDTTTDDVDPIEFSWDVVSRPEVMSGIKPTAHIVLDSRSMSAEMLADIESVLYGSADEESRLPSLVDIAFFILSWGLITITDNEDGTWTAVGPDTHVYETDTPGIFNVQGLLPEILDLETYRLKVT